MLILKIGDKYGLKLVLENGEVIYLVARPQGRIGVECERKYKIERIEREELNRLIEQKKNKEIKNGSVQSL